MKNNFGFSWALMLIYFFSVLSVFSSLGCSDKDLRCKCCNPSLYKADTANCKKIS